MTIPSIHEDFRKILGAKTDCPVSPRQMSRAHCSAISQRAHRARQGFRIDSAYQGQEAFELVKKAVQEGDPYVLAFVDVRMPPGWDGIETLEHIWQCRARTPGRHLHGLFRLFVG